MCKSITVDGGKQVEVVLVRKLPQDERDLTYEDVSGVAHTEEYDAGDINVRANRAAVKFQSMADKTSLTKGDLDGVAADGDSSDTSADGDDLEAGMSESDPISQDKDEGFSMVIASLLDDVHLNTKRQDSHLLPLRKSSSSRPPAGPSASTKAPASSSRASTTASKSSSGSLICASPASASVSDAGGADEVVRKFWGKSVEDVLGEHGRAAIQAVLDDILTIMKKPSFDSMLTGGSLGNYVHEVEGLKRKAATLLRGAVNLDIKVKKWKDVPERLSVSCVLARASTRQGSHRRLRSFLRHRQEQRQPVRDIVSTSKSERKFGRNPKKPQETKLMFLVTFCFCICQAIVQKSCSSLDVGACCSHDLSMCYFRSLNTYFEQVFVSCWFCIAAHVTDATSPCHQILVHARRSFFLWRCKAMFDTPGGIGMLVNDATW